MTSPLILLRSCLLACLCSQGNARCTHVTHVHTCHTLVYMSHTCTHVTHVYCSPSCSPASQGRRTRRASVLPLPRQRGNAVQSLFYSVCSSNWPAAAAGVRFVPSAALRCVHRRISRPGSAAVDVAAGRVKAAVGRYQLDPHLACTIPFLIPAHPCRSFCIFSLLLNVFAGQLWCICGVVCGA